MKKVSFIVLCVILSVFSSCKLSRFVVYNFAGIKDYKVFPLRSLHSDTANQFHFSVAQHQKSPKKISVQDKSYPFETFLEKSNTVAFIIIQNDSIQYEKYFNGYQQSSIVSSFSMAKSITSMLIGCAIDDQFITSVNDPITKYIPELKQNGFDKVTIKHLLQMTSNLKFNEGYANPFGDVATFYYGTNLRKAILKMKLKGNPGKQFEYRSGNAQLLGLVLERALKGKTITTYFQERLWTPLQMEYDASWSLDKKKNGLEKTFCCVNARARDFAKIGRLYLHQGNWNGKQIISKSWVQESTKIDTTEGSAWNYQYQWWLPTKSGDFLARGILGQYIYVNPNKKLVIVRLGKSKGKVEDWPSVLAEMAKAY